MRVVVTGAAGQVGKELCELLVDDDRYEHTALTRSDLDITDADAVHMAIAQLQPDLVINCAAQVDVDYCELNPLDAHKINVDGVKYLAQACHRTKAHLTTISTDYVFDGKKQTPYLETDPTGPLSEYGTSKLLSEAAALDSHDQVTIIRTSLVCGKHGSNAVKTMVTQLQSDPELRYVTDQVACLTAAADLAQAILQLSKARLTGLFHVSNQGALSRFELAQAVASSLGENVNQIQPILTADIDPPRPAQRPEYSVLDNAALCAAGLNIPRHYSEALSDLLAELVA